MEIIYDHRIRKLVIENPDLESILKNFSEDEHLNEIKDYLSSEIESCQSIINRNKKIIKGIDESISKNKVNT